METEPTPGSEHAEDVFQALAAKPRRDLLLLLAQGEASVSDLAANFDISRPAVSKHLSVLKRADLVESRMDGRKNIYRLNHEPLQDVLEWLTELDRFWAEHVTDIGERLEEENQYS